MWVRAHRTVGSGRNRSGEKHSHGTCHCLRAIVNITPGEPKNAPSVEHCFSVTVSGSLEGVCLKVPPTGVPLDGDAMLDERNVESPRRIPRNRELDLISSNPPIDEDSEGARFENGNWEILACSLIQHGPHCDRAWLASPTDSIENSSHFADRRQASCNDFIQNGADVFRRERCSEVDDRPGWCRDSEARAFGYMAWSKVMAPDNRDPRELMCCSGMDSDRRRSSWGAAYVVNGCGGRVGRHGGGENGYCRFD